MPDNMIDICFIDTETLGLDPDAPVWEFAAIRRFPDGREDRTEFFIRHDPAHWLDQMPESFLTDYQTRYDNAEALDPHSAAVMVHMVTRGASIVGAVPSFDTERLYKLLRRNGIVPEWHYHLVDVENVVVGYLTACARYDGVEPVSLDYLSPPWQSNVLSSAVGVDPDGFARHTAMGDVLWVRAQWDAVMAVGAGAGACLQREREQAAWQEGYKVGSLPLEDQGE